MRCYACDELLTDRETAKRDPLNPDRFLELCGVCARESHAAVSEFITEDLLNDMGE
jgi:hypothetical protein